VLYLFNNESIIKFETITAQCKAIKWQSKGVKMKVKIMILAPIIPVVFFLGYLTARTIHTGDIYETCYETPVEIIHYVPPCYERIPSCSDHAPTYTTDYTTCIRTKLCIQMFIIASILYFALLPVALIWDKIKTSRLLKRKK
jgi:hypothetical protein